MVGLSLDEFSKVLEEASCQVNRLTDERIEFEVPICKMKCESCSGDLVLYSELFVQTTYGMPQCLPPLILAAYRYMVGEPLLECSEMGKKFHKDIFYPGSMYYDKTGPWTQEILDLEASCGSNMMFMYIQTESIFDEMLEGACP